MASGVPSLDLLSIPLVISNGPHRFPGHDANSVTDRFARAYDRLPGAYFVPSSVSIEHVSNKQRTGEYAVEDRDDAPPARAHYP
jgi:hypothetical protein